MDQNDGEFGGFSLDEGGSDCRDAEKELFEVGEGTAVW